MSDDTTPSPVRSLAAVFGGAVLSFLAFGALWVGTPWPLQALAAIPFFALTWLVTRGVPAASGRLLVFVLIGAAPLGSMITRFRDKNDSHLKPVLIVCSWAAGAALGRFLNRKP
jgi:hypothetical protein